jgi:macrolide transport system ATP-binding/permease protein
VGALIEVASLEKTYRLGEYEIHALRGVSLTIERGELVAIMGASGSGKSTLMNVLGCLDRPTSGNYHLAGSDVARLEPDELARVRSERIGFVFQTFNLLARTTALENVELPLLYTGVPVRERRERAREALARVDLASREHHRPNQLSGGQQQRVAIARALVNRPELLLADEPTGNLDSRTSEEILGVFQALNDEGLTIVLVTHEADVARHAKRRIVVKDGVVVEDRAEPDRAIALAASPRRTRTAESGSHGRPSLGPAARIALSAVTRNKARAALTMLGVIIGTAAVIAIAAIGSGARFLVKRQFDQFGQNVVFIQPGATSSSGASIGAGSAPSLTPRDVEAIRRECPQVLAVSGLVRAQGGQLVRGSANWLPSSFQGCDPDLLTIQRWMIASGESFTARDVTMAAPVCLLGHTVAEKLFGHAEPVGERVRIKNVSFRVKGVLAAKGASLVGTDQDDVVFVPWTTCKKKLQGSALNTVDGILVSARTEEALPELERSMRELLRSLHRCPKSSSGAFQDDFFFRSLDEIIRTLNGAMLVMTIVLGGTASISLVVGGIGIMNIMLVSVTERTREIGLRMAVGARGSAILSQFLIEAAAISCTGGLMGVALGCGAAGAITVAADLPWLVPAEAILIAVGFSITVGVFFGFYPAWRASRLDPIEALRHE